MYSIIFIFLLSFIVADSKIVASDGNFDDRFGKAVSLSDNWLAIGANRDDDNGSNSGSVYVYRYEETQILEEYKILAFDGDYNDYFGKSLAIDDDWLVVGALYDDVNGEKSGSVYVYYYNGIDWEFHSKLTPFDGAPYDRFGYAVDISQGNIVVGAVYDDDIGEDAGSVYVYTYDFDSWILKAKLYSSNQNAGDFFGVSVSIDLDKLAVGSVYNDQNGINSGSVTVFVNNDNNWEEKQVLLAPDGADYDLFGNDLAIDNNRMIIGAFHKDAGYLNSGSVYVYNFINNMFDFAFTLVSSDQSINDNFGLSVSIFDNYISVGSIDDDNGINSGAVYIYEIDDYSVLDEIKYIPEDVSEYDEFSGSVSLYNNHVLVGSQFDDDLGDSSGSAYLIAYKGCSNELACNYHPGLFMDDTQCIFESNGFDCDGNCDEEIDECGVCGGDGVSGDVNYDANINVVDIILVLDYILDSNTYDINICSADMNMNSILNITDIILMLDIILE